MGFLPNGTHFKWISSNSTDAKIHWVITQLESAANKVLRVASFKFFQDCYKRRTYEINNLTN